MRYLVILFFFVVITSAIYAQPAVGTTIPEISLPNAKGEVVKLSSLKGKVVLLDFWASWCGPCRAANRKVQPVYEAYKDKGFEIYSVSIDDNTQAWQGAVNQDKMKWMQVIDTKAGGGNELTQTWNLQYIPSTFLVDKEGKLVAVAPEKEELEKWLKKLL